MVRVVDSMVVAAVHRWEMLVSAVHRWGMLAILELELDLWDMMAPQS
jgi:hypothetical protein